MLKIVLTKPKKGEKYAFLGSLKYALIREVNIFQFLTHT